MVFRLSLIVFFVCLQSSQAQMQVTPREAASAIQYNERLTRRPPRRQARPNPNIEPTFKTRPFAEYERTSIIAMSGFNVNDSAEMKTAILTHAPGEIQFLFTVQDADHEVEVKKRYESLIAADRMQFVRTGNDRSSGFWLRDAMPYPVIRTELKSGNQSLALVDAKYYRERNFEPDALIAALFQVPMQSYEYINLGGNLISDTKGNCMRVKSSRGEGVPESVYYEYYGCTSLTEFSHVGGIGDIDERIKFVSDSEAITDTDEYVPVLESKGFHVTKLPKPHSGNNYYETYANSLLVNGTLFLPIFNAPEDQDAISVYEKLGLHVFPVLAANIANYSLGNVHCYTMNYPKPHE